MEEHHGIPSLAALFRDVGRVRPDDLLAQVLLAAREYFGMDVAFLAEFAGGRRMYRMVDGDGASLGVALGEGDSLADTLCLRLSESGSSFVVTNAATDARVRDLALTKRIGAYVGVPLVFSDGRQYGTLCCASKKPDPTLGARDARFLGMLGGLVVGVLERREAQERDHTRRAEAIDRMVADNLIRTVFQPIADLATGAMVGVEALTRFRSEPVRAPDHWFNDAAAVGKGTALEVAAVRVALSHLAQLPPDVYMSVNASPDVVVALAFIEALADTPGERLVVELTEHAQVKDYAALDRALNILRARGVRIAVDDAGAGFASLRHVLRLSPDIIKLDLSLIRGCDTDPSRRALVASFVAFAAQTASKLVAEGIESLSELETLRDLGVSYGQGFYLAPPSALPLSHRLDRRFDKDLRGFTTRAAASAS